jgi:hypothetical protein
VHRRKQFPLPLTVLNTHPRHHNAAGRAKMRKISFTERKTIRIRRGNIDNGFGNVLHQARNGAGAGHRMPLVADPPGIKQERIARRRLCYCAYWRYRYGA